MKPINLIDGQENTEKRGRKKGSKNKPNNDNISDNEIFDYMNEFSENPEIPKNEQQETDEQVNKGKRGRPKGSKSKGNYDKNIDVSEFITGELFITLIDLALPALVAAGHNKIVKDKKKQISFVELRMDEKQKQDLVPIADAASKQLMLKADPLTLFAVCLIGVYASNLLIAKSGK